MKKVLLFTVLALTLSLCSCHRWQHRYPEDTERSRLKPIERLANKWWKLDQVTRNGINITDSIKSLVGGYTFLLSDLRDDILGMTYYYGKLSSSIDSSVSMVYYFKNDDDDIWIGRVEYPTPFIYVCDLPCYWHPDHLYIILQLSESKFKIENRDSLQNTIISSYIH